MKIAVAGLALALVAGACGLSIERTNDNVLGNTVPESTTVSRPASGTTSSETSSTLPPATTTTTAAVTTTTEPELLAIPPAVTAAPEGAGRWGDVVVSVETFWDDQFAAFAGGGEYDPPDRDRILGVENGEDSLPACDRADITSRTIEDNAFAAACREGQLVVWDADGLFVELEADFGDTGPTIVIAHEFGHVAQFQAGVLGRTSGVIVENQADCLAGAYAAWANDRGIAPFDTPEALDSAVGATVSFRDRPGSSASGSRAHGSGFDRVRAFQDGFDRGVGFCAGYPDTPPPITEIGFASAEEVASGGNLPFGELIDLVTPYFETFFAAEIDGWTPFTPDQAELRSFTLQHNRIGDNATGTRLAMLYAAEAQSVLGLDTDTDGALLQQACGAGGAFAPLFFTLDNSPELLRLSAGDLDESVITLSSLVEADIDLEPGFLFELVAALRLGFTEGIQACNLV